MRGETTKALIRSLNHRGINYKLVERGRRTSGVKLLDRRGRDVTRKLIHEFPNLKINPCRRGTPVLTFNNQFITFNGSQWTRGNPWFEKFWVSVTSLIRTWHYHGSDPSQLRMYLTILDLEASI
jgi:hypothetical protein